MFKITNITRVLREL